MRSPREESKGIEYTAEEMKGQDGSWERRDSEIRQRTTPLSAGHDDEEKPSKEKE